MASTPVGNTVIGLPADLTPVGERERDVESLPGVVNPPGWTRDAREAHFQHRVPTCVKYIDDSLIIEKINMKEPPLLRGEEGELFKSVNPTGTQDLFGHIVRAATEKGMVVNKKKTNIICISAATSFRAGAHLDVGEEEIKSTEKLKVLGFFFDKDGGVWSQVSAVCARLRSRSWALTKLRKCGLSTTEYTRAPSGLVPNMRQ